MNARGYCNTSCVYHVSQAYDAEDQNNCEVEVSMSTLRVCHCPSKLLTSTTGYCSQVGVETGIEAISSLKWEPALGAVQTV